MDWRISPINLNGSISIPIFKKNQKYYYQEIPLIQLNRRQIEKYVQEYDLYRTAAEINYEHGIDLKENYLIGLGVSNCAFNAKMYFIDSFCYTSNYRGRYGGSYNGKVKYQGFFQNGYVLDYETRDHEFRRNVKFHEPYEHRDGIVCFIHFSPEKVVITRYEKYFDKSGKETKVLYPDEIRSLIFSEFTYENDMDYGRKFYDQRFKLRLTTNDQEEYHFFFNQKGFIRHIYREGNFFFGRKKRNGSFGGFIYRNEHLPNLQEKHFFLGEDKVEQFVSEELFFQHFSIRTLIFWYSEIKSGISLVIFTIIFGPPLLILGGFWVIFWETLYSL